MNVALSLYTIVTLSADEPGWIVAESKGFDTERYDAESVPFNTPLGLVFSIATYFNVSGVKIDIVSESPPRSALGGSGVLGVTLVHAFAKALAGLNCGDISREGIVTLAYQLEDGLGISLSGMQDQAAAAFGGVNQWTWLPDGAFIREELLKPEEVGELEERILLAYCGKTHHSSDINSVWVDSFVSGEHRKSWFKMNSLTREFADALRTGDWRGAVEAMNLETELRVGLTPDVLVDGSKLLISAAKQSGCGARFCGSGGGGCVWAFGERRDIARLRRRWDDILNTIPDGLLLDVEIDTVGVR